jgi:hypothetical protein
MTCDLVAMWLKSGTGELPGHSSPAQQSDADIRRNLKARVAALNAVADDVYLRWAQGLVGGAPAESPTADR